MNDSLFNYEPSETTNIDVRNWKVKLEKTKRKNRVRLSIKLNKEESEGFESFMATVKPEHISKEDFVRLLFFQGVDALNAQFTEVAKKYAQEQAGALALDGVNPIEVINTVEEVENPEK